MTSLHARTDQLRIVTGTARVVLIGQPSPLRSAVARELRCSAELLACLDTPGELPAALAAGTADGAGLSGATVVLTTVPQKPGLAGRLRHRCRGAALAASFSSAVTAAREHGTARVIVLSTAFRYDDDRGVPLHPGSPVLNAPETAQAAAAEAAARLFGSLGGDCVVLRLGWTCGRDEDITRRVLSAARHGWRLIDGDPGAWVPMVGEADAARAVLPAFAVPPGTYHVTDGCPLTQGLINAWLEDAGCQALHGLDDPRWACGGALFGRSRRITDAAFGTLTGWHPQAAPAVASLAAMLPARLAAARR